MSDCPRCATPQPAGALFCFECGQALLAGLNGPNGQAAPAEQPAAGPAHAGPRRVALEIQTSGRRVLLELGGAAHIGRRDPAQQLEPEVDLSGDQGAEYGVSRLHAVLQISAGRVTITDLESKNGTLLNQHRLAPGAPFPLEDGDELHLGRLPLSIRLS
ncbi:MAG: FHA domain-containing protein [Candidatus Promineifilaceae bacterium]